MSADSNHRIQPAVPYSVQATDIVRARILNNEYKLGQRLSESELCESLGISRSPLREALRVLASEGLLAVVSGRSVSVVDFTRESIQATLEVRRALDTLAAELAAQRAGEPEIAVLHESLNGVSGALRAHDSPALHWPSDFHLSIYEAAQNDYLYEQGRMLHARIRLVRFRSGAKLERVEKAHEEHVEILAAISAHDPDVARQRMSSHLHASETNILAAFDRSDTDERS